MKDISKKILAVIKQKNIHPDPKWKLRFKSYVFWGLLAVMVFLSAVFFSLALLSFADFDFELLRQLKIGRYVKFLVFSAPYLWIVFFVFCFILGFVVFRKTRKGYRYSVLLVAGAILLFVSVLGVSAHLVRFNDRIERAIMQGPPQMQRFVPLHGRGFSRPDEGVIAGEIVSLFDGGFKMRIFSVEEWEVLIDNETRYRKEDIAEKQKVVVVVGKDLGGMRFQAFGIKPLGRPGKNIPEKEPRGSFPRPLDGAGEFEKDF